MTLQRSWMMNRLRSGRLVRLEQDTDCKYLLKVVLKQAAMIEQQSVRLRRIQREIDILQENLHQRLLQVSETN